MQLPILCRKRTSWLCYINNIWCHIDSCAFIFSVIWFWRLYFVLWKSVERLSTLNIWVHVFRIVIFEVFLLFKNCQCHGDQVSWRESVCRRICHICKYFSKNTFATEKIFTKYNRILRDGRHTINSEVYKRLKYWQQL